MLLLPGRAGSAGVGTATRQNPRRIQLIAFTDGRQPTRQALGTTAEPVGSLRIVDTFDDPDPARALGDSERARCVRIPSSRAAHPSPRGRNQILADTVCKTRLDQALDRLRHKRRHLAPNLVRQQIGQLLAASPETRMLLTFEERQGLLDSGPELALRACFVNYTDEAKVRNITNSSYDPEPLADLRIDAHIRVSDEHWFYSTRPEYHEAGSVNQRRAETMLHELRRIERRLQKLDSELGTAGDLAGAIARWAKITGVNKFGWVRTQGPGWSHDANEYRWGDANTMRWKIADTLNEFHKKHGKEVVGDAA